MKSSDEEVLSYVASTPGAIGYVSPGATLPSGVRTLTEGVHGKYGKEGRPDGRDSNRDQGSLFHGPLLYHI